MTAYIAESHANVTAMELKINPKFRDLLPPLSMEQAGELNQSILDSKGVYQPLVGWCDGNDWWLVDGHNRRREFETVLEDNPSMVEPDVLRLVADTEEEVMAWIIREHVTRRNLTPNQLSEYRGKIYNEAKKKVGNPQLGQNVPIGKTS